MFVELENTSVMIYIYTYICAETIYLEVYQFSLLSSSQSSFQAPI
jgi:hypothetical protein